MNEHMTLEMAFVRFSFLKRKRERRRERVRVRMRVWERERETLFQVSGCCTETAQREYWFTNLYIDWLNFILLTIQSFSFNSVILIRWWKVLMQWGSELGETGVGGGGEGEEGRRMRPWIMLFLVLLKYFLMSQTTERTLVWVWRSLFK